MKKEFLKQNEGITLIALVITIVILIILATISINVVLGENGIIQRAEKAGEYQANAEAKEEALVGGLDEHIANAIAEPQVVVPSGPNGKPLTSTVTEANHTGIAAEDTLGNLVYIPGGFKIASDSGSTVKEGIVVEDTIGNQFVWIPVSNINHDGSNKIKVDENTEVEITLGRYTFDIGELDSATNLYNGTGNVLTTEGTYQYAKDYTNTVILDQFFQESTTKIQEKNEVAKSLETFIRSVEINHGYYLARYEAGIANVNEQGIPMHNLNLPIFVETDGSIKPLSQAGRGLWDHISQVDASYVSQNMYSPTATVESYVESAYVESDLVNSYAWDTAIVYIQTMGNSKYALAKYSGLYTTGESGDQKCKIFDMAANVPEFTTEYSSKVYQYGGAYPCTTRGYYYVANRKDNTGTTTYYDTFGFRVLLYIK